MADTFIPIMDPVESSNVHSIGFDEPTETLFVRFWGDSKSKRSKVPGPIYKYFNVPKSIYLQFYYADSQGKFVHERLKGRYRYKMVGRAGWRKNAPSRKKKKIPAAARNRAVKKPYVPKSKQVPR